MQSRIIHPLPPALNFVGREDEIARLQKALLDPGEEVRAVSLVGIGGAGKTALAAEFLRRLPQHPHRPEAILLWSFYVDQDPASFLAATLEFVSEQNGDFDSSSIRGPGLINALSDALLRTNRRILLVLDGLERVQVARQHARREYGTLEDALLRRALIRLTAGVGQARVLITTRFPATDLMRIDPRRHLHLDILQLDRIAAHDLLRRRGVKAGDPAALDRLIDEFGSHALTLDHLGGYIASFRGGDPAKSPPPLEDQRSESAPPEAVENLIRVLAAYAKELPPVELALLQRLCLYRFGAGPDQLFATFARHKSKDVAGALYRIERADFNQALAALVDRHLVFAEGDGSFSTHPAVRDFFYSMFANPRSFHDAIMRNTGDPRTDAAWGQLQEYLRVYTMQRSDPAAAEMLLNLGENLLEFLTEAHPRLGDNAHAVFERFAREVASGARPDVPRVPNFLVSLSGKPGERYPDDKRTLDLLEELIYHALQAGDRLAAYHLYRNRLGGRPHLGKFLGEFARGERIAAALIASPQELSAMDTGIVRKTSADFHNLTVEQEFVLDRAWYLRGLGELRRAHHHFNASRPLWAGTCLVLMGHLADAAADKHAWTATRDISNLLMGLRPGGYRPVWVGWGEPLTDGEVALLFDQRNEARRLAQPSLVSKTLSAETTRLQLVMAEISRRERDLKRAEHFLGEAEHWIQRSGSVEHLILLLIARMLLAEDQSNRTTADGCYQEAMLLSRQSGFGLYHIDLLNHRAAALLHRDPAAHAEEVHVLALMALNGVSYETPAPPAAADQPLDSLLIQGALHPRCRYAWGEAAARVVLGRCALHARDFPPAVEQLTVAQATYARLGAPQLPATTRLLTSARKGR